ncbi:cytoplasmic glycerophosphodiester phosphodiesterase [Tsuneonella dongtanensis]|uniref:Cytoplasmic glycerophosphodiester phosphodiesterase n=1 Tax=Tsuneonella dongtanensis TaxID=692370 RepID=A0A1B2A9G0_9SPHN|nr:glycerophosphodiester phosphodiesterase family protein [Tsuneonella dongtanensis]ANY18772.1 cytoplasmic glycerophosphodiester phosphodiesterase [Tsuneonella dongtanensis]
MRLSPFALIDALLAPAPDPARVGWLRDWEYAHRGLHDEALAENSPAGFSNAIARGMGIECDVQKSRDGHAMVFHDWTLERLTGEAGAVAARDARDLEKIALRTGGDPIPRLESLLDLIDGRVPLLVEIKSKREVDPVPLCLAVKQALVDYRGAVAVMSFDPRVPRWFARHAPDVIRGLVVTENGKGEALGPLRRRLALWHGKPQFLAYDVRDLPSPFAAAQRARGLPLLTWTVRSPELRVVAAAHADAPIAEGAGLA